MKHRVGYRPRKESGFVLVVGLVLLLVLTIYGVTAMRSTALEERMTNNTQDLQIAFQAAEAALREAESLLLQPVLPAFVNANGFYVYQAPTGNAFTPLWEQAGTQWADSTIATGAPTALLGRSRAQYLVEQMLVTTAPAPPGGSLQSDTPIDPQNIVTYRITARAWGPSGAGNPTPMVTLQSTFRR